MITHLFIHTSLFVKNMQDLPSLILEDMHGQPILWRLIDNLQSSETINQINVVTSDNPIDNKIVSCIEKFQSDQLTISVNIIRISRDEPYKINDSNRIINSDLISRKPYYGFYSPDCLLKYMSQHPIDLALVLTADDTPLIESSLIDRVVNNFKAKGVFYGYINMGGSRIFLVPARELSSKLSVCKYKNKNDMQSQLDNVNNTIAEIKEINKDIDAESLETDKKQRITEYFNKRIHIEDVLREANDNCGMATTLQESYQFYQIHRQRDLEIVRDVYQKFLNLNIENHEAFVNEIEKNSNFAFPFLVEIELTNRCNLKCDYCPQTILKRPAKDIVKENFEKIVDEFCDLTPVFVLSGYGEPTLHPQLIDFIKYAKKKNVTRVCLETNGTQLDKDFLNQLIDAKLDILLLNLDAYDKFSDNKTENFSSEKLIQDFLKIKADKGLEFPYLALQTVNKKSDQKSVNYYYKRWEYIADAISIQTFNDYCHTFDQNELINMAPSTESNICKKTMQSLVFLSDGKPTLCKQNFEGFQPSEKGCFHELWADNYLAGGKFDFCSDCLQKYFADFLIPNKIDHCLKVKLNEKLYNYLIKEKIESGEIYFNNKDYMKALKEWEYVLKYYPDNDFINKKLDEILKCSK